MKKFFNIISIAIILAAIAPMVTLGTPPDGKPACPPDTICLDNPLETKSLQNPNSKEPVTEIQIILGIIIKAGLGIIGSLALLMLVWGGFLWLTSAGEEEKITKGTQIMLWATIGIVLVFSSYLILTTFTEYLTGNK